MLTNIKIRNFKLFDEVEFELGKTVVLIGPNNSGKTTALQALALWDIGLRHWVSKRGGRASPEKRPGVTINRTDLISLPVPSADLLWRDLHVRNVQRTADRQITQNIRIDIIVDGITEENPWSCGLEFDYANDQSFYCRPLRLSDSKHPDRMPIPDQASRVKVAFLPPMSGLAAIEPKLEPGRINVLLGEGQTAQVLRNLCYQIFEQNKFWTDLKSDAKKLFGVTLQEPEYIDVRGEITMSYYDIGGSKLDISSSGRGFQQTLLLLAHLYANPGTILLLDEPDAHLEVLRQQQIYQVLTDLASRQGSQIIAASHSEVILNQAAERDIVIAFVGKPHRIDDRGSQVLKALKEIGFEHYYLAEEKGWVLYLEGSTDLAILKTFAETLGHPAAEYLEIPFVRYVGNQPEQVRRHFWGLREAKNDLVGVALFDRLDNPLENLGPRGVMWKRREIENYLCSEEVLLAYAHGEEGDDLFSRADAKHRETAMREAITEISQALETLHRREPWSNDTKVTDEFLDPLFDNYFEKLKIPNQLRKTDYHVLARLVPKESIDEEVVEKLDAIVEVAKQARPRKA
ncbi:MAG: AAA family ATPase [Proteobacteria bacterium]|nr:AAA family ATPase [Pseudomonadota bacterium]MCH8095697.1 AAA family ATPase [Pseudomonadota bacterium]